MCEHGCIFCVTESQLKILKMAENTESYGIRCTGLEIRGTSKVMQVMQSQNLYIMLKLSTDGLIR